MEEKNQSQEDQPRPPRQRLVLGTEEGDEKRELKKPEGPKLKGRLDTGDQGIQATVRDEQCPEEEGQKENFGKEVADGQKAKNEPGTGPQEVQREEGLGPGRAEEGKREHSKEKENPQPPLHRGEREKEGDEREPEEVKDQLPPLPSPGGREPPGSLLQRQEDEGIPLGASQERLPLPSPGVGMAPLEALPTPPLLPGDILEEDSRPILGEEELPAPLTR